MLHAPDLLRHGLDLGRKLFPGDTERDTALIEQEDPASDGTESVRQSPRDLLENALAQADGHKTVVRLRIAIAPSAGEFNRVGWERMRSPQAGGDFLARDPRVYFSRTIIGYNENWREVHLRRKPETGQSVKVLVFAPGKAKLLNADSKPLGEIDSEGQCKFAEQYLSQKGIIIKQTSGELEQLFDTLEESEVDVLYLVCAPVKGDDGSDMLAFPTKDGKSTTVRHQKFAREFKRIRIPPRLVVLATPCTNGGEASSSDCAVVGDRDLAPAIAEAGIAAVITTQAPIASASWALFLQRLFAVFRDCDEMDHAVSFARQQLAASPGHRDDWWKPVLFSRLRTSRIWYQPKFHGEKKDRDRIWRKLSDAVLEGKFLPIIGPGIIHDIAGSRREIARRWAYRYGFPMAQHDRINLPQVAQYIQIHQGRRELQEKIKRTLGELIWEHNQKWLQRLTAETELDVLFRTVSRQRRQQEPDKEPHGLLAKLDLPLFLTTNLSGILEDALKEVGKDPQTYSFKQLAEHEQKGTGTEIELENNSQRPVVIHLFGTLNDLEHAALTEDDYFDFLNDFATTLQQQSVSHIKSRLVDSSLVFLGFRIYHWNFRTLFRSIHRLPGTGRQKKHQHVAVQIDPDDDHTSDPSGAKEYLRLLFMEDDVDVYWGAPADFLERLVEQVTHAQQVKQVKP